jgi:dihydrofolate reductase
MRRVVSYLSSSVDGVAQNPQAWVFDLFDEEMTERLQTIIQSQDAVLLGRATYDTWSQSWPRSTREPFASFINNVPKYVVSQTLTHPQWHRSSVMNQISTDLPQLKRQPGRDIGVHGSVRLVRWLLQTELLDELKLAVFPTIAGSGQRLFDEYHHAERLELAEVERTKRGVALMTYKFARTREAGALAMLWLSLISSAHLAWPTARTVTKPRGHNV